MLHWEISRWTYKSNKWHGGRLEVLLEKTHEGLWQVFRKLGPIGAFIQGEENNYIFLFLYSRICCFLEEKSLLMQFLVCLVKLMCSLITLVTLDKKNFYIFFSLILNTGATESLDVCGYSSTDTKKSPNCQKLTETNRNGQKRTETNRKGPSRKETYRNYV